MPAVVSFPWRPVSNSSFGHIFQPVILLEVQSAFGDWKIFYPLVDSGANISIFNSSDSEFLGLKLKEGQLVTLSGMFGVSVPAYVHKIRMKIGEQTFESRAAFSAAKDHRQILGRIDVFDVFSVMLRGKTLQTAFIREE